MRAPLKFAAPPRRTSQHGTPDRSDATASRRVAVKSSARGSPQISPMTAESAVHLTPSSIAHSASRASRASTWMRFCEGRPGGWTRPLSRIAMRSWIHSTGLPVPSWAERNPAQPPSRGCSVKNSERVGCRDTGSRQGSRESRNPEGRRDWPPALAGTLAPDAETAPPATRDKPLATRLTTFLFCFCSYLASRREESIVRLRRLGLLEKPHDLAHCRSRRTA